MRAQRFEYQQFIVLYLPFVGTIYYWNPTGKGMQRHAVMIKDMLVRALLMTAKNKEKARRCMALMEGRRRRDTGISPVSTLFEDLSAMASWYKFPENHGTQE
ncbi:hypothetical protein PG990_011749 [Apiospora arundinis]